VRVVARPVEDDDFSEKEAGGTIQLRYRTTIMNAGIECMCATRSRPNGAAREARRQQWERRSPSFGNLRSLCRT
jgi:hypothetical protein